MEGLWDTTRGVPMTVLAWPDMQAETNRFAIDIPHVASLYLTHSLERRGPGAQGRAA